MYLSYSSRKSLKKEAQVSSSMSLSKSSNTFMEAFGSVENLPVDGVLSVLSLRLDGHSDGSSAFPASDTSNRTSEIIK